MHKTIVLYDGECEFCKKWIGFFKKKINENDVSFIKLESENGALLLENFGIKNINSIVFINDNIVSLKSEAVLKIFSKLRPPYNRLRYFSIIPKLFLNKCYDFIAKRRLKIYSKNDCCYGK